MIFLFDRPREARAFSFRVFIDYGLWKQVVMLPPPFCWWEDLQLILHNCLSRFPRRWRLADPEVEKWGDALILLRNFSFYYVRQWPNCQPIGQWNYWSISCNRLIRIPSRVARVHQLSGMSPGGSLVYKIRRSSREARGKSLEFGLIEYFNRPPSPKNEKLQ